MRIKMLSDSGLLDLQKAAEEHPEFYVDVNPDVDDYACFDYPDFQIKAESYPELVFPNDPKNINDSDYQNSMTLYKFFAENRIPLSLLFDPRYLSYLTHFVYLDYMRKRWPVEGVKSKGRVMDRYFTGRAPYGRQGILGLFWPAYLLSQTANDPATFQNRLRYYFCGNRSLRDKVIEHKYARNPELFLSILENMRTNPKVAGMTGKQINIYPKTIQNILSVTSLDLLDEAERNEVLNQQINAIAKGAYDSAVLDRGDDEEEED